MERKKIYVSAPFYNEPQQIGLEEIKKAVGLGGFDCVLCNEVKDRPAALREADLVLAWLDGLLPQGVAIAATANHQDKLQIAFPDPIAQLINIGMKASGQSVASLSSKKQTIILPGQVEEQAGAPKGMTIGFPPNVALVQMVSPPINMPDGAVMVEVGMSLALDKPLLVLAMAPLAAGDYIHPAKIAMVSSTESLCKALGSIQAAPSITDGLAAILNQNIEDLKALQKEAEEANGDAAESVGDGSGSGPSL